LLFVFFSLHYIQNMSLYFVTQRYLHKYGYLNCTVPDRRRRRHQPFQPPAGGFDEGVSSIPRPSEHVCSDQEVRTALRKLQQRFDLDATGRLDDDTKSLMSRGRCGNTDSDDRRRQLEPEPETVSRVVAPADDSAHGRNGTGHEVTQRLERGRRRRQRRSPSSSLPEAPAGRTARAVDIRNGSGEVDPLEAAGLAEAGSDIFAGTVRSSWSAAIDHDRLSENIVDSLEYVSGSGLRRRQEMLRDIIDRRRRESVSTSSAAVSKPNLTVDELDFIRRIRSMRAIGRRSASSSGVTQLLQQRQQQLVVQQSLLDQERIKQHRRRRRKRRRRRSISVDSIGDNVHEGPTSGGSAAELIAQSRFFRRDDNSPVQWRLLDDGVSGKIPLSDQRSILELAFRMWSEVIPLKFSETNNVAVQDMDVIIAFAKRKWNSL
jgi:hypothetical protein